MTAFSTPPGNGQPEELRGVVERIVFTAEDGAFQVVRFRAEGHADLVTLAGNLPSVHAGEPLAVRGAWKNHRQHGATFEVQSYLPILPTDPDSIAKYLGSGLVKGIGPAYAKKIVDKFGDETLEILDHAPEQLAKVKGLGRQRAQSITKAWADHRQTHEVLLVLAQFGLAPALSRRLLRHYGAEAAAILRTNPYRVGMEVHGIGFLTADRMAQGLGIEADSPQRIAAALVHLLDAAADDGHTLLPREILLQKATELLALPAEQIEAVLDTETGGRKRLRQETLPDGREAIFTTALYLAESGASRLVNGLLRHAKALVPAGEIDGALDTFEKRFRFELAPQQREAIRTALRGGVMVITGGPGTGKTTLVRALLHVVEGRELKVALCSPTGRAAQRLSETTRHPATTIHRLLKYNPQRHGFTHGPESPLAIDLLIVDESSMLDVVLAYALLGAVRAGTAVIFVGDADQLPSVGPGNLLRDLIESGRVPTVRLQVIFRQASASAIIVNSHRVNQGLMPLEEAPEKGREPDFFFIERDDPASARETLLEMLRTRIPRKFDLDPVTDVQVLTPMRRGELGTHELNRALQQAFNKGGRPMGGLGGFAVGDKVIQNANNYDLDVYNGDVGRIVGVFPDTETFRVVFGRRPVEYRMEDADQLSLAYAVTIHKSQGSEYPAVAILLHTQHYVMLRRNLIYTAITRGRKLVVVIGSKKALRLAVQQDASGDRHSALKGWLSRPPGGADLLGD